MEHPTPTSRLAATRHCTHLRHKGMYVLSAPNPDEAQLHAGSFAATPTGAPAR